MAKYTAPVTGIDAIKAKQQELGVTVDGKWGAESDAAYKAQQAEQAKQARIQAITDQVYSKISTPAISYATPSTAEIAGQISAYMRPSYDQAIASRKDQTISDKAAIDADAASRGMGRSTYVTDVKDRAADSEAGDIAKLESNYNSALAQAVQEQYNQNMQNALTAQQFNASAEATAKTAAYQSALSQYQQEQASAKKKGTGSGGGTATAAQLAKAKSIKDAFDASKDKDTFRQMIAYNIDHGYYDKYYGKGMGKLMTPLLTE